MTIQFYTNIYCVLYISYVKQTTYLSGTTVFLWAITQRVVVIPYRRFGPIFKDQESKNNAGHLQGKPKS